MNDYYKVNFTFTPANTDAGDLLAAYLADEGFESFEQDESLPGATMTGYVPSKLYDNRAVEAAVAELPFDCEV